jgi:hypothetical protein
MERGKESHPWDINFKTPLAFAMEAGEKVNSGYAVK